MKEPKQEFHVDTEILSECQQGRGLFENAQCSPECVSLLRTVGVEVREAGLTGTLHTLSTGATHAVSSSHFQHFGFSLFFSAFYPSFILFIFVL